MKTKKYDIEGMTCSSCSAHIEKEVKGLQGVRNVNVNLLTNSMAVDYDENKIDSLMICESVRSIGYNAKEKNDEDLDIDKYKKNTKKMIIKTVVSIIILFFLMYVSMGVIMWGWLIFGLEHNYIFLAFYELILSLVIIVINFKFFRNGFKGLLHLAPNMDALISLGSGTSFVYSVVLTIKIVIFVANGNNDMALHHLHNLYFESAAMILIFISIGKILESYSKGKTTSALQGLMGLAPKTAKVEIDGVEKEVLINDVKVDDIFVVKPGESIPVDGVVIEGETCVDESSLTGESIPNDKGIGAKVNAGTINQNGYIKCKAEKVGKDTTLNKIIQLIEEANTTKAPIAKIADNVSKVFVPIIIALSIITFIVWIIISKDFAKSLNYGICVLVISCPCALGLATPVAIMVGSGIGARKGILYKTATSLEMTGKGEIIVLDKTGTVTEGNPKVKDIIAFDNYTQEDIMKIAGSLEAKSEHPLAKAIVEFVKENGILNKEVEEFSSTTGFGIKGKIEGNEYLIGKIEFVIKDEKQNLEIQELTKKYSKEGKTIILVSTNKQVIGMITISDKIKQDSIEAINKLKKMNKVIVLLTGDNKLAAESIAKELGLENRVIANVTPIEKEIIVKRLQEYGKVIMVGDGINDALSLTRADIGISIANGNDIAKNASDVILMKSNMKNLVESIQLSNRVILNIKENLFWAFIYNIICIPIAAGVFAFMNVKLTPMYGALAMSFSSVFVVLNALRLNICKIENTRCINKRKIEIPEEVFIIKEEKNMKKTIYVEGMMCEHCVAHVRKALEKVEGVKAVEVSLKEKNAVITCDNIEDEKVKKAIEDAGYTVTKIINE